MSREDVYNRLNEVFRDVFDDEKILVDDKTTSSDIDGWDSLAHITLVATVEDEFEIHFDMEDIAKMKNVGIMVDLVMEQLNK